MMKTIDIDPLVRKFSLKTLRGKGVRGEYFALVAKGTNLVRLSPEVARLLPTEAAVNNAVLLLAQLSKSLPNLTKHSKRASQKRVAA